MAVVKALPKLAELWNQYCGEVFPKVYGCSRGGTRDKGARARWEEIPDEAYWIQVIERMKRSDFLTGKTDRIEKHQNWKCDFDWLVRPDSHNRVMEGKYENREPKLRILIRETPDAT